MNSNILALKVETLIDSASLARVLETLAAVCAEKAAYVRDGGSHGSPSPALARQWQRIAAKLSTIGLVAEGL